ncbi:MAG: hypothetical protein PWP65_1176 [Clostridia bacterium]|nr:hypothetical protein [Clostridia bacterium]
MQAPASTVSKSECQEKSIPAYGIIIVDLNNTVIFLNQQAEELLGIAGNYVLRRDVKNVFDDPSLLNLIADKTPYYGALRALNGRLLILDFIPVEAKDEIIIIIRPVTGVSYRDKDNELVSPNSYLWQFNVFESLGYAILIVDKECVVRYVNENYTKLKKIKKEDILGKPLQQVRPAVILPQVLATRQPLYNVHRKIGEVEYVTDAFPLIENGCIQGAINISRDIKVVQNLVNMFDKKSGPEVKQVGKARYTFQDLIGCSGSLKETCNIARKAAQCDLNVLIQGESGTGKELIAQAIHNASSRANYPFVAINCAAVPQDLLETELFGHEEGAYTGARKGGKKGLIEMADGGTVFLDEIGDMSLVLQAKILRVIQEQVFRRVGGTKEIPVNVRFMAATNKNLFRLIEQEKFREDLYYRLNVIPIYVPALRERPEDIPILAEYFLEKYGRNLAKPCPGISPKALEIMIRYPWPGNVRELENTIAYLINMVEGEVILPQHLPQRILEKTASKNGGSSSSYLQEQALEAERNTILQALRTYGTSTAGKRKAAEALGISLSTLYNKLKQLGIEI